MRKKLSWRAQWFGVYSVFAVWAPILYFIHWWRERHHALMFDWWSMTFGEWIWVVALTANSLVLTAGLIEASMATEPNRTS